MKSRTCSLARPSGQQLASGTGCDGLHGGDATSIAPKPATTSDRPVNDEHNDLRLEY
jgi:hypothetical protein